MSVAHSNQKDRCPAIVPAALFTHKQMLNLGCFTLAALDQELSSVASVNLDCDWTLLKLVRLFATDGAVSGGCYGTETLI